MLSKTELHQRYLGDTTSEGFLKEAFHYGTEFADPELEYLAKGRDNLVTSWLDINTTMQKLQKNHSLTAGEKVRTLGEYAKKRRDDALTLAETVRERATKHQEHVQVKIQAILRPASPYDTALCQEIRTHLRGLPEGRRYDTIAKASGDDAILFMHAIAGAPPVLSGVTDAKWKESRTGLLALHNPTLWGTEMGLHNGIAMLDKATNRYAQIVDDHVDFDVAAQLRSLDVQL
jgi:hypothetical protein